MNWTSHLGDTWCVILLTVGSFTAGCIAMYSLLYNAMDKLFPREMSKEEVDRMKFPR